MTTPCCSSRLLSDGNRMSSGEERKDDSPVAAATATPAAPESPADSGGLFADGNDDAGSEDAGTRAKAVPKRRGLIQDDDDDWQRESGKMELVFSTAYCTIGASSAKSSLDGFLHDRVPRSFVKLCRGSAGIQYVCVDIDDLRILVSLKDAKQCH